MARERRKEGRRDAIIAAAEALIRETGSTDFSVGMLAIKAGVSIATLYNLIGSKGTVLYVLLNRSMDLLDTLEIPSRHKGDPFEQAIDAADVVAQVFIADPDFMRPLYRFLLGVIEPVHRPALMNRALSYWESRLRPLDEAELLPAGIDLRGMAREYLIYFAGALDLWVQGELSDPEFRVQIRYGCLLRLLALGDRAAQARLLEDLGRANQALIELAKPAVAKS
jgi:AcrR family transcriptional regulator